MPGLALTTVWVPETTPQLLYCSAGSRSLDSPTAAVETTSAGCDAAMCYAARRETGGPSTRRWTFGPPQKNVTSDRGPRWRVCCYRDARVAIGMVAQDRFGQSQLRSFAERIAEIVAPVVDECAASAAHANAALAILAREVERCNDRGLGHLVPLEAASACVACGGALGKRGGTRDAMAVNCHDCGDVLCALCAPQLPGSGDGDEASGPRRSCGDCAHARQTGRRVLRMQPPTGGDEVKAFALRALFDERASDEGLLDEAGFVELCKAACRHPLVVEPRSLERELRHGANVLRLDVTELERRFRSAPQAALDFEAARNCLVESCRPAWPERALAGPPPDDDEETKDEETKEERVVEDPAARAAAWKPDKKPALRHASRTGWGSLVSRDGLVKKRVWLELRDAPPRTLRYAPDTASPRRALVYLNRVRVIRCDAPCTLQLRLNLPNDDVGDPDLVDAVVLRFETPSATCSWWSALSASRREAKTESRGALAKLSELSTLKTDDAMSYIVGGAWYNKMANFLVCAVDCTGGQPFEGPERPFMQLNRPPGPAPARVPGKPLGGAGNARKSSIIRARDVDRRGGGDDFDADPVPELGDSLPERAFSVAGPEVKAAYQSLLKVIIRPPRATYDERRLGVADFAIKTEATTHRTFGTLKSSVTVVHREDLSVPNERGLEVRASLGIALCAVDCARSAGGEFVSLGRQAASVALCIGELKRKKPSSAAALWGRSMGAATALLYASTRDPDVAAVVADSPYNGLVALPRASPAEGRRSLAGDWRLVGASATSSPGPSRRRRWRSCGPP
ncbi:palmitoyl-(protein) hydrolase [Aureococcus anophagefferens]|uniref:Palmitoyl-(Protein) hydrolase n=1 Tax=Aureococcus anophagefferens TaxID=44056 RepID=A0ABR1FG58_AURAN